MTVPSSGDRIRRGGRRPGWALLTVLLVLAIAASTALVFTNRVELLKLAVILALWAAVVGAFVSVIYRRQSDADSAKARDLKLVYDLQLEREISARREYELNVEAHLRRELAHELRTQSADEVAALRAELNSLRTTLEILFDTDLAHRPALETDRSYAEWTPAPQPVRPDRVASSRITEVPPDEDNRSADDVIIDVPEEPLLPPAPVSADDAAYRGSHRRPSEETGWIPPVRADTPPPNRGLWTPPSAPAPSPAAEPPAPMPPAAEPRRREPIPAPPPGDLWTPSQPAAPQQAAPLWTPPAGPPNPPPQMVSPVPPPPPEPARPPVTGGPQMAPAEPARRGRHSSTPEAPPVSRHAAAPEPDPVPPNEVPSARHGGDAADGGQSVAELLARLQQNGSTGGGRRRRRED